MILFFELSVIYSAGLFSNNQPQRWFILVTGLIKAEMRNTLDENLVDPNPFIQFELWYNQRLKEDVPNPGNMVLGTSTKEGQVSLRTVLLKEYNERGFVFYTNYNSRKGVQLQTNPAAALHFYWSESARQIRIEGIVVRVSSAESDNYFNSRPEESRISAWTSDQSTIIPNRKFLEDKFNYYKTFFSEKPVKRPVHWGGYRLIPSWFEFWQEGPFRLHDRISYTLSGTRWIIARLAP
jgi:pyridoxamine 5'-phosphate oxidase